MATNSLSPFVYWGQNGRYIFLKVDICESMDVAVDLTGDGLDFKANGVGVGGRHDYAFNVEFYLPINEKDSKYRITERCVDFKIEKVGINEIWPRLMINTKKPAWLKIDFDRFALEDDSEEEKSDDFHTKNAAEAEMAKKIEDELMRAESSAWSDIKTIWLFVYNTFQWVGYSYVFLALCLHYMKFGEGSKSEALDVVGSQLSVCQLASVLEVIHALTGLVRTGFVTPLVQIGGRNVLLFMIIIPEEKLQSDPVVWWLFLTWSAIELVRYPYYMLSSIGRESRIITWLRYTMWIPLYPLGFTLEGIILLKAIPIYDVSQRWSVDLPNSYNMSFSFPLFLKVYLVIYVIGIYILLKRIIVQRKQKLRKSFSIKSKTS
ncbi:hypothetical protein LSH36_18g03019 [Paralvinella palmiformis]|uniref:Very-long-chain (3R)-3-hydroxyacyl-CoA dehydratase n=1 Tax=Paralvinella palmiformis TaxID=53620 RepID=A0AAD9KBH6_9ANNE|nr:hypothetical protein LSH36_18g03019 [Paralvinella palmiformis]